MDITEAIDDYCETEYGHTDWAWIDTVTKDELNAREHVIEGSVVIYIESRASKMETYTVGVHLTYYGSVEVKADTEEDALRMVKASKLDPVDIATSYENGEASYTIQEKD